MDVRKMRNELLGKRLVAALESRNMEAYYVETKEDAVKKALELIPKGSSINMGGATSVKECGLYKTEADAMSRARNEAAPINAQRFGIDTPCSKNGTCFDCKSPQCICCQILTTRFSRVKGRFQIILVDENLGF